MMKYVYLILAIVLEVFGSSFLKATNGFTKVIPTIIVAVSLLVVSIFYR